MSEETVRFESDGHKTRRRSRRDLLKLAGAAAVGAAGAAALRAVPAAATNGDPITVGGSFFGTTETSLTNTAGNALFVDAASNATGLGALGFYGVFANGAAGGVGVTGQSSGTGIGVRGENFDATGLGGYFVGGRAPISLSPAAAAGPPASGLHATGDLWVDSAGILWICIGSGTPGVFAPLQTGRANLTHFAKVINTQQSLPNSDGVTWVDMDATNLVQVIQPNFNAQAVISVSADLWTANAGFNQDIGIFISGGAYGAGQIVAWKESGGFAGTFSPNAAFVETTQPLVSGTIYTIKVRWKTNKNALGATIFAGAGPLPPGSGGGGVAGQISPTRLAIQLVVDVPSPVVLR